MIYEFDDKKYNSLIEFAKTKLYHANHLDPRDVVNEIVTKYLELPEWYLIEVVKNDIWNLCLNKPKQERVDPLRSKVTTRVCTCCNEIVPINGFYLVFRKNQNQEEILYQCKECQKEWRRNHARDYDKKPETKALIKEAQKRYRDKNKNNKEYKKKKTESVRNWMAANKDIKKAYDAERNRKKRKINISDITNEVPL